jgi:hypothetical protein
MCPCGVRRRHGRNRDQQCADPRASSLAAPSAEYRATSVAPFTMPTLLPMPHSNAGLTLFNSFTDFIT